MNKQLRYGILEVTRRCQLRCEGCYMWRRNELETHGEMSLEQAIRVLDACRDFAGRELESMDILGGEPLLWSHLKEYIEILLARGIKPWIFTNMLAVTSELARWLFERQVYVTGKLNIGNLVDDLQVVIQAELIHGNYSTVAKMFAAIDVFHAVGYRNPMFRLENLIRRLNRPFVRDYLLFCKSRDIGVDVEIMACGEGTGDGYFHVAPTPQELTLLVRDVLEEMGGQQTDLLMPHILSACRFFDSGLYFAMDGHIRACSNSKYNLANMNDMNPIATAWDSTLLANRRCLTQENVAEPCHSCDRFDRCRGGCRATVEGDQGSFGGYTLCPLPHLK